ncbi:DoxX family protein [Arcobacter sp. s6]|jgi:hypothetical protein|uniref:DoxX family protein n=1 Tax=Arcobacter sp. s6 TaxID=3230363 RepID=UPI0034A05311
MFFKIIRVVFLLISSITMLRFALPKLQSMPVSVKSFTMFSEVLPINGSFFMYFTGFVELLIAVLLLASLFIRKNELKNIMQTIAYVLLFATMLGAILIEQFVRVSPVAFLMSIALILITISISELSILSLKKADKDDK